MKNNFKLIPLLFLSASVFLTACEKEDLADTSIQGTWYINWVKDFAADPPNPQALANLCLPGNTVDLGIAGLAETRFQGNRSASELNTYLRLGNKAGNNNTLSHTSHYIGCDDIAVSSIEHRAIYITGQPGYISKQVLPDGRCVLQSDPNRNRTRPKYTVFISLLGEQTRVQTNNDGSTVNVTDRDNRLAGITYDCDDGRLEQVYRHAPENAHQNVKDITVKSPTVKSLKDKSNIFNNKDIFRTSF